MAFGNLRLGERLMVYFYLFFFFSFGKFVACIEIRNLIGFGRTVSYGTGKIK